MIFWSVMKNLLRDDTVSADGSVSAAINGVSTSANAGAAAVWVIPKKRPGYNIIHLVNLLNNSTSELAWNDTDGTYSAPITQTDLPVKMYYTGTIGDGRLFYATPDNDFGAATELSFITGSDGGGNYINFTVPQLEYWDMIWLEINGTTLGNAQIQAEDYDTYSAVGTESCSDTDGGLNIGYVNNLEGDSYVGFGNINFSGEALNVSARVASGLPNGTLEFHLDSPTGPLIATVSIGNTGGWQNWQTRNASVSGASGVHDIYAVFKNAASNLNWFTFTLVPYYNGDLTFDGKVNMEDMAELGSDWQTEYDFDNLLDIADDWLSGSTL